MPLHVVALDFVSLLEGLGQEVFLSCRGSEQFCTVNVNRGSMQEGCGLLTNVAKRSLVIITRKCCCYGGRVQSLLQVHRNCS